MNKMKGDVAFDIDDKKYILRFDHNALIELEDILDKGIVAISNEMQTWQTNPDRMRLKWVRALLYVGLKRHHPKISLDDVSEIMTHSPDKAMSVIGEAMGASFGSSSSPQAAGARPTSGDSRNGTGIVSSPSTSPMDTSSMDSGSLHREN